MFSITDTLDKLNKDQLDSLKKMEDQNYTIDDIYVDCSEEIDDLGEEMRPGELRNFLKGYVSSVFGNFEADTELGDLMSRAIESTISKHGEVLGSLKSEPIVLIDPNELGKYSISRLVECLDEVNAPVFEDESRAREFLGSRIGANGVFPIKTMSLDDRNIVGAFDPFCLKIKVYGLHDSGRIAVSLRLFMPEAFVFVRGK